MFVPFHFDCNDWLRVFCFRRMIHISQVLACVWALLSSCGMTASASDVDYSRFERTTVGEPLVQPMELEIAPDGRIFLIEISGVVKLIDPSLNTTEVVAKLTVTTEQENGLIGLALDPRFADNGWIYLQYSPPDFSGQHISRFTFRDNQIDLSSEKVLFKYEEQRRECCHHAGSVEFGPDGTLYIGTGDNTNPFDDSQGFAPIDQRPNREPWDAQRSSANTKSYNGKILRIQPEANGTYSIPDGNLFPKDGSIGHPEIYVMGCRNPWRINVDQRTGFLYWGDVGPDAGSDAERGPRGYDEINQAREAGFFGWPYFIGDNYAYAMVDFVNNKINPPQDPLHPLNESVNNSGARELPPARSAMIYYPSATYDKFPEVGSGGRTACAGPVYYFEEALQSTTKFPEAYNRTLFAFEWSRNWILAVHLDAESRVERLEPFLPDMKFSRPIDLQFDANGALYVIEYGETWGVNADARLVRIDYQSGNRAPVAKAEAKNGIGREPLTVDFSSAGSMDKDNDALTYQWTSIKSGTETIQRSVFATTVDAQLTFSEPGVYTVELAITDTRGATGITSLPVIVGNSRPTVEFLEPRDGDFFTPGLALGYKLQVSDVEDGTSDFAAAEEHDLQAIDGLATSRLFVEALPYSPENNSEPDVPGLALMRKSDCFNCHASNRLLVGPSFVQIAEKYRDQPHAIEQSVARVQKGSTGVWGKVAMLPHAEHTPAQVQQMVEYVYSVQANTSNPSTNGFNNELEIPESMAGVRLEATYTDLGRGEIPKLSATSSITLRSRTIQAEAADEFRGTTPLDSGVAEGKRFMGAIEHDGYLRFASIRLDAVSHLSMRVASAGAGGTVEIRRGAVDGPLLGSTSVEVNGEWESFYEKRIALKPSEGRAEVFIVFKNTANRGGLMNIDSITFLP